MKQFLFFCVILMIIIAGCSSNSTGPSEDGNDDNNPTYNVTLNFEILATDIADDFYLFDAMDCAPDCRGGFYFMDWHNAGSPEQQIIKWSEGAFEATGLTPSWFIETMGFETGSGTFEDIATDEDGNLYILLDITADENYLALFYQDFTSGTIYYLADTDVMSSIIHSAGLYIDYYHSVKSKMAVTDDKNIWLVACDDEDNLAVIYFDTGGEELQVSSWTMPETDYWSFYDNFKTGLGNDGDLLLTDCEHGTVWRCDAQTGVEAYISLENFPETMSAFIELDDGSLVFASNYVSGIEITFITDGQGYIVEEITGIFGEGYDKLFYAIPVGEHWEAYYWDSSDIVEEMGRDGIPGFWHFRIDPYDNKIILCDEEYGDVYKLTFDVLPVI